MNFVAASLKGKSKFVFCCSTDLEYLEYPSIMTTQSLVQYNDNEESGLTFPKVVTNMSAFSLTSVGLSVDTFTPKLPFLSYFSDQNLLAINSLASENGQVLSAYRFPGSDDVIWNFLQHFEHHTKTLPTSVQVKHD